MASAGSLVKNAAVARKEQVHVQAGEAKPSGKGDLEPEGELL